MIQGGGGGQKSYNRIEQTFITQGGGGHTSLNGLSRRGGRGSRNSLQGKYQTAPSKRLERGVCAFKQLKQYIRPRVNKILSHAIPNRRRTFDYVVQCAWLRDTSSKVILLYCVQWFRLHPICLGYVDGRISLRYFEGQRDFHVGLNCMAGLPELECAVGAGTGLKRTI